MTPQGRLGGRDGSTATRSSSMTLKLVNGGVPTTVRAAVAELAGGVQPVVTLISPSACMWSCLLCNATGEKLVNYFRILTYLLSKTHSK